MSYLEEIARLAAAILGSGVIVWIAGHALQAWIMWMTQ